MVALQQEAARFAERIDRLTRERETIRNEQKRIRENLQALGDRATEKDLRERFVRTLNTQEDRLESIDKDIKEQTAGRDRCREEINQLLASLEYEAAV